MDVETVMGVNLKAGVAYLGVVKKPFLPVVEEFLKVEPPRNVDDLERLVQFGQQFVAAARACKAVCVTFADPRTGQWPYSDAFERISLHTAAALALKAAGIEVRRLHAKTAAKLLGFAGQIDPMDKGIAALLGLTTKTAVHWKERCPAFEVAAAVAKEKWNG